MLLHSIHILANLPLKETVPPQLRTSQHVTADNARAFQVPTSFHESQSVAQPARNFVWGQKILGEPKFLILGQQQYFLWDAASQSTKWLHIQKIWGAWFRWPPWLRLWSQYDRWSSRMPIIYVDILKTRWLRPVLIESYRLLRVKHAKELVPVRVWNAHDADKSYV